MKVNKSLLSTLHWRSGNTLLASVSQALKGWLLDKGSLTERLMDQFDGDFRVEVLSQRWGTATLDEAKTLGIPPRDRVLIREVLLFGGDRPRVYARSILPRRSLTGRLKSLIHLNNRPLGAWLFKQPDLHRDPIEVANFQQSLTSLPSPVRDLCPSWGRRSVFYVERKPLLVSEIFLQSLTDTIEQ